MSAVPPPAHASLIQTQGAQARATQNQQKETVEQSRRNSTDTFADRLQEVIENEDADARVHSDAEGAGSQGRAFTEGEEQPEQDEKRPPDEKSAGGHVDLQA